MEKWLIILIASILIFSCQKEELKNITTYQALNQYFNEPGKHRSFFKNSDLIFGDTLDRQILKMLKIERANSIDKVYRRSLSFVRVENLDSIFYFIYGVGTKDSLLNELRINSFFNGELVTNFQLINLHKYRNVRYMYLVNSNSITVRSFLEKKEHYSTFSFFNGVVKNSTLIPDSIFERYPHDFYMKEHIPIALFNDYKSKKFITEEKDTFELRGEYKKVYGGKGKGYYLILQLESNPFIRNKYVSVYNQRNTSSPLYLLESDEIYWNPDTLMGLSYPVGKISKFLDHIYADYLRE